MPYLVYPFWGHVGENALRLTAGGDGAFPEPLRPWKREQLGRGYDLSSWVERTTLEMADAVIAVSRSTAIDVERLFRIDPEAITVIPNGIDTDEYAR